MTVDRQSAGLDQKTPNVARIYDYLLGGKDNFAVDREIAARLLRDPQTRAAVRANRAFLIRAVRYLAEEAGIRQFLDIGTGLPTQENVHEVAHQYAPDARVVYVDNDPVVLSYARALLDKGNVRVVEGDLRRPAEILANPEVRQAIDFAEPVGILLVGILHFIRDADNPYEVVATLRNAMMPGSFLVVSHGTGDEAPEISSVTAKEAYDSATAALVRRSKSQFERFFDGLDMVSPGVVGAQRWRQDPSPTAALPVGVYAGIGRQPDTPVRDGLH
jgi:hypothetical protein